MEIIKSNKGANKLVLDNYMYVKKKTSQTAIIWECVKRKSHRCRGQLKTDLNVSENLFKLAYLNNSNLKEIK